MVHSTLRRGGGRQGVTLIELMLAFLVMAIATLSASGILSYGHRGTTKDFRRVEALQVLTDRMNRLTAMTFKVANGYLDRAGADTYTFTDPMEDVPLGDAVMPASRNRYRVTATLKRQAIVFPPMMALRMPDPGYRSADVQTWQFVPTGNIVYDGAGGPYKVIKVTVSVQPLDRNPPELAVQAVSFVVDLES